VALIERAARLRVTPGHDAATRATVLATLARRVRQVTAEARALEREIARQVSDVAPELLAQPGVGPIMAAQVLLSWSHQGRVRSEAAFARMAGAAPILASSGQVVCHRLDRGGDRQLNRALHTILIVRRAHHRPTADYMARRLREGKSEREAMRCLKRYLARSLFRLLEACAVCSAVP